MKITKPKLFYLLSLFIGTSIVNAQEVVPTTGGDATGNGGSSSYTIGQIFYTYNAEASGSAAQGVQNPYEIIETLGVEEAEISLRFLAYPNPTNNFLTLMIGNYNDEALSYHLSDIQGRLLDTLHITNNRTTISMVDLPHSTYFLKVTDKKSLIKTFKIIKN